MDRQSRCDDEADSDRPDERTNDKRRKWRVAEERRGDGTRLPSK